MNRLKERYAAMASFNSEDHSPVGEVEYPSDSDYNEDHQQDNSQEQQQDISDTSNPAPYIGGEGMWGKKHNGDVEGHESKELREQKLAREEQARLRKDVQERERFAGHMPPAEHVDTYKGLDENSNEGKATVYSGLDSGVPTADNAQNGGIFATGHARPQISDKEYLASFFPNAVSSYSFKDDGELTGVSDVQNGDSKRLKEMLNSHRTFFSTSFVSDQDKAKELAARLNKVSAPKSSLFSSPSTSSSTHKSGLRAKLKAALQKI